ncbi:MAG: hypothetical protein HRT88_17470 [Lentisphaeraceae bacterium]|nr:hypothetical protein [Lentisphaeraceae bacterium]
MELPDLLNSLICCPACKGKSSLIINTDKTHLTCDTCNKKYSVKKVDGPDGKGILIPNLLIDDSE